jgi:hypothetical protein
VFIETLGHDLLERDILRANAVDRPASENSRPVFECKLHILAQVLNTLYNYLQFACSWFRERYILPSEVQRKAQLIVSQDHLIRADRP